MDSDSVPNDKAGGKIADEFLTLPYRTGRHGGILVGTEMIFSHQPAR